MTDEEKRKLKEAAERLRTRWMKEAVAGPLTGEGDVARRLAAYKHQTLDEVLRELEMERMK